MNRWISLCCGLGATETRAMTGRFPPLTRMGGKRSYADHVLEILGEWPRELLMVDADLAIVEFWDAAFSGELAEVSRIIRAAPLDGEELWRAWVAEPVPSDRLERIARWVILQKGNFSGKPMGYDAEWVGVAGRSISGNSLTHGITMDRVSGSWK